MPPLAGIDGFGAIDADSDDLVLECFADHQAYQDLLNMRRFLVIGRKGSGKTAIFRKLLKQSCANEFTLGHNFEDYPWHLHDKQAAVGMPDHEKYLHSWKYLIAITLSKILLNFDNSLPFSDASQESLEKIERFVIDSYGSRDPDITQIFGEKKQLRINPTLCVNAGFFKAEVSPERLPIDQLPTVVQEVNRNMTKHLITSLNPENRYFVCFDQLDLNFDPDDPNYVHRLIGLLKAARDFNVSAKQTRKKLLVVIFLRDDIYARLHFEDKNKLTENYVSVIEWDRPGKDFTLKSLMEKRFRKLIGEGKSTAWDDVFDETKDMTGHQSKYQHILDRTFMRPRDIIMFCNRVLDSYRTRMSSLSEAQPAKFENVDIHAAREDYSQYLLNELDDELHKHIPNYREYLELFKSLGYSQFSEEEFARVIEVRRSLFTSDMSPIIILKQLYGFSIVGYFKVGGAGYGGSEWVFKYKNPRDDFDESSKKFRIHPGLTEALGLKRYSWTR